MAAKKTAVKKTVAKKTVAKKTVDAAPKKTAVRKPADSAPAADSFGPMLQPGDVMPDVTLPDQDDQPISLRALRGKKAVIYFYPRDNTPGCKIEAQDFSRLLDAFKAKNTVVYGISTDGTASHRRFQDKCALTVPLLADPDRAAHQAFGAWGLKNMYGRVIEGTIRSTFLFDEEGRLVKVWPKVKVADHALEVLNAL